jgi:hypothetical protein
MYINSNMSDEEVIRCTFGTTSPLIRILADRLTDKNRQLDAWQAWSDRLVKSFDALEAVVSDQPTDP